jgi:hypothetical protein
MSLTAYSKILAEIFLWTMAYTFSYIPGGIGKSHSTNGVWGMTGISMGREKSVQRLFLSLSLQAKLELWDRGFFLQRKSSGWFLLS